MVSKHNKDSWSMLQQQNIDVIDCEL